MMKRKILFAGIAASLIAAPAFAHHSFAMFDASKTVTLNGTVKSFEWTNPHMWLTVMVPQASGQPIEYPLEMQGIMKVTAVIHPLKDGTHGGQLLSVVLASGDKVGVMGGPAQ